PLTYTEDEDEVFLGRSVTQHKHVSDETARRIDDEVRKIIDAAHDTARELLTEHRDKMDMMADALMKYETIDTAQIDAIMEGREPPPPEHWNDNAPSKGDGPGGGQAEAAPSARDEDEAAPPIGGPANQT
ncbi:MAG: ATP-dependent metalloprotease, partial [Xanthomonadales bacterium]|nr:ATP-dependent metalloprotease [Xanthomonadales bacterium]